MPAFSQADMAQYLNQLQMNPAFVQGQQDPESGNPVAAAKPPGAKRPARRYKRTKASLTGK